MTADPFDAKAASWDADPAKVAREIESKQHLLQDFCFLPVPAAWAARSASTGSQPDIDRPSTPAADSFINSRRVSKGLSA